MILTTVLANNIVILASVIIVSATHSTDGLCSLTKVQKPCVARITVHPTGQCVDIVLDSGVPKHCCPADCRLENITVEYTNADLMAAIVLGDGFKMDRLRMITALKECYDFVKTEYEGHVDCSKNHIRTRYTCEAGSLESCTERTTVVADYDGNNADVHEPGLPQPSPILAPNNTASALVPSTGLAPIVDILVVSQALLVLNSYATYYYRL